MVDVQSTFLGTTSKSDMIKEIGKLRLRHDPNLPRCLTKAQKQQARSHPGLQEQIGPLEQRQDFLKQDLQARFGTMQNGKSTPEYTERKRIKEKIRGLKVRAEKELFNSTLQNFHDTADLNHMLSQLEGKTSFAEMLPPKTYISEERQRLAATLFKETTETSFAQIVEDLSTLCTHNERCGVSGHRESLLPQPLLTEANVLNPASITNNLCAEARATAVDTMDVDYDCYPTLDGSPRSQERYDGDDSVVESSALPGPSALQGRSINRRICLFCGPAQAYTRTSSLRKHYMNSHFQHQVGTFICPVPGCNIIIANRRTFASHATKDHKNDIGVRATLEGLMKLKQRPHELAAFIL